MGSLCRITLYSRRGSDSFDSSDHSEHSDGSDDSAESIEAIISACNEIDVTDIKVRSEGKASIHIEIE